MFNLKHFSTVSAVCTVWAAQLSWTCCSACRLISVLYTTMFCPCVWNRLIANYITFAVGEVLLLILTVCSLAAIFPRVSYITTFCTFSPNFLQWISCWIIDSGSLFSLCFCSDTTEAGKTDDTSKCVISQWYCCQHQTWRMSLNVPKSTEYLQNVICGEMISHLIKYFSSIQHFSGNV